MYSYPARPRTSAPRRSNNQAPTRPRRPARDERNHQRIGSNERLPEGGYIKADGSLGWSGRNHWKETYKPPTDNDEAPAQATEPSSPGSSSVGKELAPARSKPSLPGFEMPPAEGEPQFYDGAGSLVNHNYHPVALAFSQKHGLAYIFAQKRYLEVMKMNARERELRHIPLDDEEVVVDYFGFPPRSGPPPSVKDNDDASVLSTDDHDARNKQLVLAAPQPDNTRSTPSMLSPEALQRGIDRLGNDFQRLMSRTSESMATLQHNDTAIWDFMVPLKDTMLAHMKDHSARLLKVERSLEAHEARLRDHESRLCALEPRATTSNTSINQSSAMTARHSQELVNTALAPQKQSWQAAAPPRSQPSQPSQGLEASRFADPSYRSGSSDVRNEPGFDPNERSSRSSRQPRRGGYGGH